MARLSDQFHQVLIAADQFLSTLVGLLRFPFAREMHWADETLSAMAYRNRARPGWRLTMRIIDAIFFFDTNHCRSSHYMELQRKHLPPSYSADAQGTQE